MKSTQRLGAAILFAEIICLVGAAGLVTGWVFSLAVWFFAIAFVAVTFFGIVLLMGEP